MDFETFKKTRYKAKADFRNPWMGIDGKPREGSVQASRFHYCIPRVTNAAYYEKVELGYPSKADAIIIDYAEGSNYTDTVYGYVPVEIVDRLIAKHGGIDEQFLNGDPV